MCVSLVCVFGCCNTCLQVRVQLHGVASFFLHLYGLRIELKMSVLQRKLPYLFNHLVGSGYKTFNDHMTMKLFHFFRFTLTFLDWLTWGSRGAWMCHSTHLETREQLSGIISFIEFKVLGLAERTAHWGITLAQKLLLVFCLLHSLKLRVFWNLVYNLGQSQLINCSPIN